MKMTQDPTPTKKSDEEGFKLPLNPANKLQ